MTQGWLPSQGVDIYRSDNPTHALNTQPILLDSRLLAGDAPTRINRTVAGNRALFETGFRGTNETSLSSRAAFLAYKSDVTTLQGTAGIRAEEVVAKANKNQTVLAFRTRLKPGVTEKTAAKTKQPALSDDDKAVSTRIQTMLAALNSYVVAQKLGLAYIDTSAQYNTGYTYTLRAAGAGATSAALATVQIAAGGDTAPPAPSPIDAAQVGTNSLALHWEPVTAAQEQALVAVSYNVFREGSDTPLNAHPIRIAFLATSDGGHVAPMTSFIDDTLTTYGDIHYTVTATDAFGRTSVPSAVIGNLPDLRVPDRVNKTVAVLSKTNPGAVRVYFLRSGMTIPVQVSLLAGLGPAPPAMQYDVYRTATGETETTLTQSSPIPDVAGDPSAGVPPQLSEMTLADFAKLDPDFAGALISANVNGSMLSKDDFNALLPQTVDKTYAKLSILNQGPFARELLAFGSYLDTTPVPDKNYIYRVAASYTQNATHHGLSVVTSVIAVPTTAVPPTPAGLAGTYAKGAGSFGFVVDGSTPVMRTTGVVGAEVQKTRLSQIATVTATGTATTSTGTTKSTSSGATAPAAKTSVSTLTGGKVLTGKAQTTGKLAQKKLTLPTVAPQYLIPAAEQAPPVQIGGRVTLSWQAAPFTSPVRYRIYRASATGLFSSVQVASTTGTVIRIGAAQRASSKTLSAKNGGFTTAYYEDYTNVPNQNYGLIGETTSLQFVDTMPMSQRMHYHYVVIPVSRWGVEGTATAVNDVLIPATLPPAVPTLLKTQVDEGVSDGHVRLVIATNPANENVVKYYIFRKSLLPVLQAATLQARNSQIAAKGKFAPPVPTAKFNPNVPITVKSLKANNSALLKAILKPSDYANAGTLPVTAAMANTQQTYADMTGVPKTAYVYEVVAVNEDGISSQSSSPLAATAFKVRCESPQNFVSTLDTKGDSPVVTVTWAAPATEKPAHYVLERASVHLAASVASGETPLGGFRQPASTAEGSGSTLNFVTLNSALDATILRYQDSDVRSGRRYTYRLRAVDADGLFSADLDTTRDVPALAAASFSDPAPAPVTAATTPPATGTTPAPGDATTPAGGTTTQPAPGGTGTTSPVTPVTTAAIGAPQPASKTAHFQSAYYLNASQVFAVQVVKASYQATSYAIDATNFYYCRPAEKFVKVTLSVKNVSAASQMFDYQTITAGGIGPDGDDLAPTKNWKALDTNTIASRTVAAGATFQIEGVITMPADGDPKSLVFGDCLFDMSDAANHIDPLPALFGGGSTVLPELPVQTSGTYYPLAFTDGTLAGITSDAATRTVSIKVRNTSLASISVAPKNYTVEMYDQDGDKYTATKTSPAAPVTLAPGAETTLQFVFAAPQTIHMQSVKARERDGRVYVFPTGAN